MNTPWTRITSQPDQLGESPFWHPQQQRLYWVDIPGRRLARLAFDGQHPSGPVQHWALPEEPGCIAPLRSGAAPGALGEGLVLALRSGIYLAPTWGGALRQLAPAPYDCTRMRFNDGKCDAQGRFWIGSLYEPKDQALAALYRFDAVAGLQRVLGDATTANGLAWSPDERTLYWADTAAHCVRAYGFDPEGGQVLDSPPERTPWHQMPAKPPGWTWDAAHRDGHRGDPLYGGRPDGAAVDAQGAYWSAQYEGQRLLRLSPDGQVLAQVPTPVPCPTMPCFGGPDLKTLFITSSRQGRSAAELAQFADAGCVFAQRQEVAGQPVQGFDASAWMSAS